MQSALSFAPLRPVGFVNFHGAGRGVVIIPGWDTQLNKKMMFILHFRLF